MTKVIVAGSRSLTDYDIVSFTLDGCLGMLAAVEIVSGECNRKHYEETGEYLGADMLGVRYAKENGHQVTPFPADWATFGAAAGPVRNEQMAKYADWCILFWDGKSKGSASMKRMAIKYNLFLKEVLI